MYGRHSQYQNYIFFNVMFWLTQWLGYYYDHKPQVGSLLFLLVNCWLTAFLFWLFVTCIFCIFIFFLFWWFITVHWNSFKNPIYLYLRGSGRLHDETQIWRCNPNHRQSISPAFHQSLAKYDDYFTEGSCSRCQNFRFGKQTAFGNMWTLQRSWLPT